jgi:uncharacterized membrane protein
LIQKLTLFNSDKRSNEMNVGVFIGALSSSGVEFFETAAIAYAIARSGYKREAIWGTQSQA